MSKVRFAVIGFGHIGRRHAALVAAHPDAELVGVCDVAQVEAGPVPPSVPVFESLSDLLKSVPFDVACVCTPNGLHADQAIACLEAGRHVVVEKPIALTVPDCDRLITVARAGGLHVFGVMQNRYSPASAWLKSVVDRKLLGRVLQVHLDCFWNRDGRYYAGPNGERHPWHGDATLDGGVLFTQFAHFIDLLCWTFPGVTVTSARHANQTHADWHPFPDTGMIQFRLPDGGFGSLNYGTVVYDRNFESTLSVLGDRGTVKLGGQYMNELRYCHVAGMEAPELPVSAPPNDYGPYQGSAANHHFVIDNAIRVLREADTVATSAEEGREVVRFITRVEQISEPV